MSGHSKWSTIKRQKGVSDIKRGQVFTKISRTIAMAVREGNGIVDPNANFKLRLAIEKAKEANMPKENIQRAIDKGSGKGGGETFESIIYEGYGPHGVAFVIETATDNKARTSSLVKHLLDVSGGNLGGSGSVMFSFEQQGYIFSPKKSLSEDQMLDKVIEAGGLDMVATEDGFEIYTSREELHAVKEKLTNLGVEVTLAELVYRPKTTVPITEAAIAKSIFHTIEALEELDDVQKVYTNEDIDPSIVI
jgi:YebC/PmpR family DNA-binding regulatory protein